MWHKKIQPNLNDIYMNNIYQWVEHRSILTKPKYKNRILLYGLYRSFFTHLTNFPTKPTFVANQCG